MALHNDLGHWGEQKVAEFLENKGWYIRAIDWKYRHYDLDVVAIDESGTTIRIVEVKTRSSNKWGEPDEAIDLEKKKNILKAGAAYLRLNHLTKCQVFYDTASVIGTIDSQDYKIIYKKNVIDSYDSFAYYENKRKSNYYKRKHTLGGQISRR